jgi:hypothetical protein
MTSPLSFSVHKLTAALVAGSLSLGLAGCGGSDTKPQPALARIEDLGRPEIVTVDEASDRLSRERQEAAQAHAATQPPNPESAPASVPPPEVQAQSGETTSLGIQGVPAPPQFDFQQGGNALAIAGVAFTVPDGWKVVPPANNLRAAQYALPGPGGDAEAVFFYFGPGQGGNVSQNVSRWVSQFSEEGSSEPIAGERATFEQDNLRITLVRTQGTYNPGTMGGGDPTPQPNFALFGLVVEGGPQGNIFVKVTGPIPTMEAQRTALEDLAKSSRLSRFR